MEGGSSQIPVPGESSCGGAAGALTAACSTRREKRVAAAGWQRNQVVHNHAWWARSRFSAGHHSVPSVPSNSFPPFTRGADREQVSSRARTCVFA